MGRLDGFFGLRSSTNKVEEIEVPDGVIGEFLPELKLTIEDKELIKMKKGWEERWKKETIELTKHQKRNEDYWLGKHFEDIVLTQQNLPPIDNRLFSSLETFLPIATRKNPEPLVEGDDTEDSREVAETVKKMLVYQSDIQRFKLKLKSITRNWALYHLGVLKVGWDDERDDIMVTNIRPQRIILDPDAAIEEGVDYTGEYIGEIKRDTAANLVERFSSKKDFITRQVKGKMGTKLQYIEWWTDDFTFWTLKDEVLDKFKNPHWNYEENVEKTDEFGNVAEDTIPGVNHFLKRKMPYVFMSIFNIGKHPWDDTSLFQQNIPLQDALNKRMLQVDRNVDNMNSGVALSGDHFTKEQAATASQSLRDGGDLWVPTGDVRTAFIRESGPPLPADVFNNVVDLRNEIDNIFGTHGTTRGERGASETATGRVLLKEGDESRIGGGVTEYLEQVADSVYNWWVQLMYVYYDEPHTAAIVGSEQATEHITLVKDDLVNIKKLTVSVKEGSLIPTDELTKRNEAIDLWGANAISILDLYIALKLPDPQKATERWIQQQTDPTQLIQEQPEAIPGQLPLEGIPLAQSPILPPEPLAEQPITPPIL